MNYKTHQTTCRIFFLLIVLIFTISSVKAENGSFLENSPLVRSAEFQANSPVRDMAFGSRIAIDGDTAVVGAVNESNGTGAVYVFLRSGKNWIQQARLQANDIATGDAFGFDIGISGNTIVTSSYRKSGGGAVYVFVRSGITWTQQQRILSSDLANGDLFGYSVGISGDTIITGSPDKGLSGNDFHGSSYIFVRSGTTWTQQQILNVPNDFNISRLGRSVRIDGDKVIIGAPEQFIPNVGIVGTAFVFIRSGTNWTQEQKLNPSVGIIGVNFGEKVDISSNTIVVGSPEETVNGNSKQGAVYVFMRSGTTWIEQQKIVNSDGQTNDSIGCIVAIDGDTIVTGRIKPLSTVYVFTRSGTNWSERRKLTYSDSGVDPFNNIFYASSIAVDGNTIMTGATRTLDINSVPYGSVFAYTPSTNKVYDFDGDGKSDISIYRPSSGIWYLNQSQNGFAAYKFGISSDKIAPADYDGDGKADITVYRDGVWYNLRSSDGNVTVLQFGLAGDKPMPGDYDGDEKADISVFRPSNNVWYRLNSSNGSFMAIPYGQANDKPLLGNFDGDLKSDLAVYRPSTGQFYWMESTTGFNIVMTFGNSTDIPTIGDYDGDGKSDVAVFRPSNGVWYRINSSNGSTDIYQFGINGDIPVPAGYNGNGKTDSAVYRPSNGFWYVREPTNGSYSAIKFGLSEDTPIPASFIQ